VALTLTPPPGALILRLPWAALCSDNRKYLGRQFILSNEYRRAKEYTANLALAQASLARWQRLEGPVGLHIAVREPDRRRRDLNWSKQVKDSITASEAVWWDDSQVRWELWWFEPQNKANAGATVTIFALDSNFP
jgi:Holliday junction resolvase RusA-like endonuclease